MGNDAGDSVTGGLSNGGPANDEQRASDGGEAQPPLAAFARSLERLPNSAALIRIADRRVVWANEFLRSLLGIDEWPEIDLASIAAPGEHEAVGERLRDYARDGGPFSVVRSFVVAGEYVQVLLHYWDPFGAEPREYVALTARGVERAQSQQVVAWIEDWPQVAAVVHREYGIVHANLALRELVGAQQCAQNLTAALTNAVGADAARRLSDLGRGSNTDTVICRLSCADGRSRRFIVAPMAPLVGGDPDVTVLVGHVLADADAGEPQIALPSSLSPREREITALLLDGHRVGTVAERLSLSPHTVRNHLRSIFIKLGVKSQSELIATVRSRSAP